MAGMDEQAANLESVKPGAPWLLIVTCCVGLIVVAVFLWNSMADAYPAFVRSDYMEGKITLEQAREREGEAEVASWPIQFHERARIVREAKNKQSDESTEPRE
jgi:hypothetical protein